MESVEEPESEEAQDDLHIVESRVFVHALVVGWVDWVVAGAIAGEFGIFAFLSVCVDGSQHFLYQEKMNNKSIINPSLTIY